MRKPFRHTLTVLAAVLGLGQALGQAQNEIDVDIFNTGEVKAIPVHIEGFTGEVLSLLKFDLFVQGFEFVDRGKAQFTIKGSNTGGSVTGAVYDHLKRGFILNKRYQGGSLRLQGHTFANNVVETITGSPGIGLTKIAFRQFHGRNTEIHVADFDGHNAQQLTRDNSISAGPDWSPDGGMLFYYSYLKNNPDIYSHNIRTGQRRIVARFSSSNISPTVSPDGKRVAMVLSKAGSPDIWVASTNGTNKLHWVNGPGFIVGCDSYIIDECFGRMVFGMPESYRGQSRFIHKGSTLLLFHMHARKLLGVFEATSNRPALIEPNAWAPNDQSVSPYPVQIRFRIVCETPMMEEAEVAQLLPDSNERVRRVEQDKMQEIVDIFVQRGGGIEEVARRNKMPLPNGVVPAGQEEENTTEEA